MKKFSYIFMLLGLAFLLATCSSSNNDTTTPNNTTGDNASSYEITGLVYEDLNQNQMQDSNEQGIPGVKISYDKGDVKTDMSGRFTISTNGTTTIEVDDTSIPEGYTLTTNNDRQTIANGENAEEIGYAPSSNTADVSIETILNANHDDIKNYEFDLYLNSNGMEMGTLHYASDGANFVAEDENTITYYLGDAGKIAVYTKAVNQVVVTPSMEATSIATPFTITTELDPQTFDAMYYKGTTSFEDKTVYVFKNEMPGFNTELYIWPEYNIIVHMATDVNGYAGIFEFRNLEVNKLNPSVFEFPANAEIIDVSNMGN